MEKLVYVLWKRGAEPNEAFKRRRLDETAPRLALRVDRLVAIGTHRVAGSRPVRIRA